jgi:type VI secretion system protein ImpG
VRDELLSYYERELTFLRQMGAEFASKYAKIAGRLMLEPNRCEDPHVERLLEGVALLAARIHLRLDDEFPEISQALLDLVVPHYTRPIPSMTIAELRVDPAKVKMTTVTRVPRETMLYSKPVLGTPVRFRTCYDTELWPLQVVDAQWRTPDRLDPPLRAPESAAAVRIEIACAPDVKFTGLTIERLRFFLQGESAIVHSLHELLHNNCTEILLRDPRPQRRQRPVTLPSNVLRAVGFADQEAVLPFPSHSFAGYRILQEYFSFPDKFLFLDLGGLDVLRAAGFQDRVEIIFLLSPYERTDRNELLELGVTAKTFRLGCTPIVNLFHMTAEPIQLDLARHEYQIQPDARRPQSFEIYSVDEVVSTKYKTEQASRVDPIFSFHHSTAGQGRMFCHLARRDTPGSNDGHTDMFLSLVDLDGNLLRAELDHLTVRCTCTNAAVPSRLPFGDEGGDFEMEGPSTVHRIVCLRKPTATVRHPLGRGAAWRLISHLSLNYLSLVEEGRGALQEILRLYQATAAPYLDQQIDGITSVRSSRQFARLVSEHGISHLRGMRIELELDEDRFVGGGVYLFSSVLEHFLAQYVSMNSFTQLAVRTRQRKEPLCEWNPRAGNRSLI